MKRILSILVTVAICSAAWSADKPNILFIAVDDLKPMLGCYGDDTILTPHIDRLAARGMVFLNNSCQQSVCAPSRVSLMTGTYPDTTRVFDLKTQMRDANPETLTLPEYLQTQGYQTTGVGKIYDPRSVDKQFDGRSWTQPFLQHGDDRYYADGYSKPAGGYHDPQVESDQKAFKAYLRENGISKKTDKARYQEALVKFSKAKPVSECLDVPDNAYDDGAFADCALDQMAKLAEAEAPFFLAVGFKKPHLPFVAPKKYWDIYERSKIKPAPFQQMPAGAPDFAFQDCWELRGSYSGVADGPIPVEQQLEMIHGYRACVSYTDAQVGKLLDKLDSLNLAGNTIVVLWGDHGWHLGDHGMFCKHTNYEQAVRSPLIIAAPGVTDSGQKTDSPTEFVDIFPTLCELAGLQVPERVEGTSLVPVLQDSRVMVREAAMEQFPRNNMMGYTLRDKRYRYVKWVEMDFMGGERAGKFIANELYDYEKDPLERVNLAGDPQYSSVVEKFERLFTERVTAREDQEVK